MIGSHCIVMVLCNEFNEWILRAIFTHNCFSEVDRSRLKSMSERLTPRIGDMRVEDENGEVHIMSTQV